VSSRATAKGRARDARIAAEQQAAQSGRRRRRLIQIGAVTLAAALILAVLIVVSQAGNRSGGPITGGAQAGALFAGIPQHGNVLGGAGARGTMTEFADLQCPFCAEYANGALPEVVRKYVRPGRVRLELNVVAIIGPDSEGAARATVAAGLQQKMWQFADVFYRNQGTENTGYADKGFIKDVAQAVPGLDADRLMRDMNSATVSRRVAGMQARAEQLGVSGTPTFFISTRGGTLRQLPVQSLEVSAFTSALDALSAR
jgi:protein-disulfide isomerase